MGGCDMHVADGLEVGDSDVWWKHEVELVRHHLGPPGTDAPRHARKVHTLPARMHPCPRKHTHTHTHLISHTQEVGRRVKQGRGLQVTGPSGAAT